MPIEDLVASGNGTGPRTNCFACDLRAQDNKSAKTVVPNLK